SFGAGLVALMLAKWHKKPLVMTYHTLWEDYVHYVPLPRRFVRWVNAVYSAWLCNRCKIVIAPTGIIREVLVGYGTRARVEVLPTGLNAEVFATTGAKKADFGAAEGEFLFSCAGRTGREKRMDLVMRALASIDKQLPPWKLIIAGDGTE